MWFRTLTVSFHRFLFNVKNTDHLFATLLAVSALVDSIPEFTVSAARHGGPARAKVGAEYTHAETW